jgi:DNA adenine methylase
MEQTSLFAEHDLVAPRTRPRGQLLKWVGNKQCYAELIAQHLPKEIGTYFEPFVGTGAVLATMKPQKAVAGDTLAVLIDLLKLVQEDPNRLLSHYARWRDEIVVRGRSAYEQVKERFNENPNPDDLLVLSRTCYGGVVRFTRAGTLSTPMGPHKPMPVEKLSKYMADWKHRLSGTTFVCQHFSKTMAFAGCGDTVYCDPPYQHGQKILYGAHDFHLDELWDCVSKAVDRGARVAVSIDGYRRSGSRIFDLGIPKHLFVRELVVHRGGCMLRRFQMVGSDMTLEHVADRLLLSW